MPQVKLNAIQAMRFEEMPSTTAAVVYVHISPLDLRVIYCNIAIIW